MVLSSNRYNYMLYLPLKPETYSPLVTQVTSVTKQSHSQAENYQPFLSFIKSCTVQNFYSQSTSLSCVSIGGVPIASRAFLSVSSSSCSCS